MTKFQKISGQILVEAIISVGLIGILVAAVVPLTLTSVNANSGKSKNAQAAMLAKEEIDAAKAIKEEDWNNIYFPLNTSNKGATYPYHLEVNEGKWQLVAGEETVTQNNINFKRFLIIENVERTEKNGAGEISITGTGFDDPSTQKITVSVCDFAPTPILVTEYVTRWQNQISTESDWSTGNYSAKNNIDETTTPGALQLSKSGAPSTGSLGNKSLLTSTASIGSLNSSALRLSLRFSAQKSATVNSVRIYIHTATGSSATYYRYGLQADNAGLPSGTYLGYGTAAFSTTGWQSVNLSTPIDINVGQIYHLVVMYDSGTTPSGTRYIALRYSLPINKLVPLNQAIDNNQNVLWYSGSWAIRNYQPIYVLGFDDNTFEGNPYDSTAVRSIYGVNFEGEVFTATSDTIISAINLYVSKSSSTNPADSLYVTLRDVTTSTDIIPKTVFSTGSALATTYAWKTYTLPSNLTLSATHQYRLSFSSPTSISSRCYRFYNASNPDNAAYNNINWNGLNSVTTRSANSGSSWTAYNFVDLAGYYFTTIEDQPYAANGDLTSQTIDLNKKIGLNQISWNNLDLPLGTTIYFQLAANNDDLTWNFLGPNGTATDYYTALAGENILSNLSNNRYIRYKVYLQTSDTGVTPALDNITINHSP